MRSLSLRSGALFQGFRSLGNRNYRLYWFGQLVSLGGTWMQDVALSWLVLSLTDSPAALGLTMTIRFLPALVLSLFGGVLADRLPKRRTIIVSQCIQLLVALTLAILTSADLITVTIIYVLAGVRGAVDSIEGPTRQAFVPEMVESADLPNAVALNSTQFNAARVAGPAVGAIVIGTAGLAACFYVNAASFLAVIVALLAMRTRELHLGHRASPDKVVRQLKDGFRYVRSTPEVVLVLIVMGAIGTFGYNFQTLLPLVTRYLLASDAAGLALLMTAMGVGAVTAGLIAAYRCRPTRRLFMSAAGAFALVLFLVGLSSSRLVTMTLMFFLGVSGVLFTTTANTRLQLLVPADMRGRVMGMYVLLFVGTTPIGSMLIGQLAERSGVRPTVLAMAGLCAVGVLAGALYARRTREVAHAGASSFALMPAAEARNRSAGRSENLGGGATPG